MRFVVRYQIAAKITMRDEDVAPYLDQPFSPGLLGYKLIAGLSIAYVLPEICDEGIRAGIIEPPRQPLEEITYRMMRAHIGLDCHQCLSASFLQSSVSYLKDQLERINDGSKIVGVTVYATEWYEGDIRLECPQLTLMEEICVDLEHRTILSYRSFLPPDWFFPFPLFVHVKTYEHFLDCLARKQYMEYRNTGSLFECFRRSEFYDVDRFLQRIYKLAFALDPEQMTDEKGEWHHD